MSEEPETKITLTDLSRPDTTPVEPAAWANLANTVMQDQDVSILRCTNPAEAITYEEEAQEVGRDSNKEIPGGPQC